MAINLDQYERRLGIINSILDMLHDMPLSFAMESQRGARNWILFYNSIEPYDRDLPTESAWSFIVVHFGRKNVLLVDRGLVSKEVHSYPTDNLPVYQMAVDIREILKTKLEKRLPKPVGSMEEFER